MEGTKNSEIKKTDQITKILKKMTVTDCNTGSSLFCLFVCSWQPLPNPDVVAEMYQSAVEVKKSWHQTWKTKYTVPFLSQLFRSFINCSDHAYYLGIHGWVMTHIWVNQVSTGTLVSLAAVIRVVTQRFSPVVWVKCTCESFNSLAH